jgi:hypothetical protein
MGWDRAVPGTRAADLFPDSILWIEIDRPLGINAATPPASDEAHDPARGVDSLINTVQPTHIFKESLE